MPTTQFTVYKSIDADAPVLNGTSGSLVNVLNSILVTGYGSKPGAGWIVDYTSSVPSGSTFRPPSGSSNAFCLSVDDRNFYSPYGNSSAVVVGLETPINYNTGSARFPSVGQNYHYSLGLVQHKNFHSTADYGTLTGQYLTARPWICFVDDRTMYFFAKPAHDVVGYGTLYYGLFFGDFYTFAQGDIWNCMIVSGQYIGQTATTFAAAYHHQDLGSKINTSVAGHYAARTWGGGGGSIAISKHGTNSFAFSNTTQYLYNTIATEVNPENNAVFMSPLFVTEPTGSCIRGKMRGMYFIAANASVQDGEQFSGSGDYTGKTFYIVKSGAFGGLWAIETSNTVDAN